MHQSAFGKESASIMRMVCAVSEPADRAAIDAIVLVCYRSNANPFCAPPINPIFTLCSELITRRLAKVLASLKNNAFGLSRAL